MEGGNRSISGLIPGLDLQSRPEILDTIQKVEWKEYNTLSELNNSNRVYNFHIPASNELIDLKRSKLKIYFRPVKPDGSNYTLNETIKTHCNQLNGMISSIEMHLNDILISPSIQNHAQVSQVIDYTTDNKRGLKKNVDRNLEFYKQEPTGDNIYINATLLYNSPYQNYFGQLENDVSATTDKWILNNVKIDISITLESNAFYFQHHTETPVFDIIAMAYVPCKITMKPGMIDQLNSFLTKEPIVYNYQRNESLTYEIGASDFILYVEPIVCVSGQLCLPHGSNCFCCDLQTVL